MVSMKAEAYSHGAMGLFMKDNLSRGKYVAKVNLNGRMAIIMKDRSTMASEKVKVYFTVKITYIQAHGN